ncbi:MAG: glycosyltransferase [Sulfitobacter sp.]
MSDTPILQIKGLIRFSYLSHNGFKKSDQGMQAMQDMLYAPDRLSRRFELFEKLCLHSLFLQEDTGHQTAVLIGDSFPPQARARLESLTRDLPQLCIVALPPMSHIRAVNAAYAALPDLPGATHTATFRLDDDDAMHRATTARLRKIAMGLLAFRPAARPFGIAFNRGFYLDPSNHDEPLIERFEKTPLGVGMAVVTPKGMRGNAFRRNHRNLPQFYDCFTDIDLPMFIRSVHQDNDSGAKPSGRKGTLGPAQIRAVLRDGFDLTFEELRNI